MSDRRRPLVLTGGPAAGKSTTARLLAKTRARSSVLDVDDLRGLVVRGIRAPWEGAEGQAQHVLGVENACALGRNFLAAGFDCLVADVVTTTTLPLYRAGLPDVLVFRLDLTLDEARRRSRTRHEWLSEEEFGMLHRDARWRPIVDHTVWVDGLHPTGQARAVDEFWTGAQAP